MSIAIAPAQTAFYIGAAKDTTAAKQLETQPVKPEFIHWQDVPLQVAFLSEIPTDQTRLQRMQWLLEQFIKQHPVFDGSTPVFLILPELSELDSTLANFIQQVTSATPLLLIAPFSRVFPYGSAGVLMALNSAVRYLEQNPGQNVWLVGVDSACSAERLEAHVANEQTEQVLSEGVIALRLKAEHSGYRVQCYETDACLKKESASVSVVPYLFDAIASQLSHVLTHVYLPDCGDSGVTEQWLSHYHLLRPVVTLETQLTFPSYSSGELGACGGMFRLWHALYSQTDDEQGVCKALLEISEQSYCAMLALYKAAQ